MPDPEPEHRGLVERAVQGDEVALEQLTIRHLPGLTAYVQLHMGELLRRRESCADLVQSVCREALGHANDFEYRGEAAFRSWLFALALSKVRDRVRFHLAEKRNPGRELAAPDSEVDGAAVLPSFATPSQVAIRGEEMQQLEAAFARLPEDYRAVVVSSRLLGLSHAEIAQQMGRSEAAVRVLLHRALVRLGWLLTRNAGDEG